MLKTNDQPLKAFQFRPTLIQSIEGERLQGNEYLSIIVQINPFSRRKMLVEPDWCTQNKLTKDLLEQTLNRNAGSSRADSFNPPKCHGPQHNKKLVARGTSPCSAGGEKADLDLISKTRPTQWLPGRALPWMETINSSRSQSASRIGFTPSQLDSNQMYNWHKRFVQTQIIVHVPYSKRKKKKRKFIRLLHSLYISFLNDLSFFK